ncbi:MAG: potassium/proton antiporter [Filifactor alocis]|nr:potassium/proton antiporter [Filifactor alocis]
MDKVLLLGALIVLLCIMSIRFSNKFNIPSLLLFVALGMLLGSDGIFKVHFDNFELSQQISVFCLIYIMFYGGFGINWKQARPIAFQAGILSSLGVIFTCIFVGLFCHLVMKVALVEGMLIGAVLSSTDAASVFNILKMRKLNLKGGIAPLLEMESGSNDPFSYMLTIVVLGLLSQDSTNIISLLFTQLVFGAGLGIAGGVVGVFLLKRLKFMEEGIQSIFVAMVALVSYALPAVLNGNGFLSVYIAGIILGNAKLKNKVELVMFFDALTQMMQIVLFFFMGFLAFPSQIPEIAVPAVGIALFLTFVARPLSVFLCLLPFRFPMNQKLFISWSGLRGAASIVFAIMTVVSPVYTKNDIFHIVFFVALISITFQGGLLPLMAKKFKVVDNDNDIRKTFNDYIDDNRLELISLLITGGSTWKNKELQQLKLPENMLAVSVIRKEETILPKGSTKILEGDTLVLCCPGYEGDKIHLDEVEIDPRHEWINRSLNHINVANNFLAVMIKRSEEILIPRGDVIVQQGDVIVLCKRQEKMKSGQKKCQKP